MSSPPGRAAPGKIFRPFSLFSLNSGSMVISPSFLLPEPSQVTWSSTREIRDPSELREEASRTAQGEARCGTTETEFAPGILNAGAFPSRSV